VDTDEDPYSIKKGFWYAHILWMFEKTKPLDLKRVPDLTSNPLVMFQHRYYGLLCFGGNIVLCGLLGWLHADLLGAFVLAWWTRLLVSHHLTWFVNSLAHTWGEQTYSREQSAVDNYILAFLTVGEGYHNYHHTFAADYRNGHRWYHFDPTKWTIWTLSKLGQSWDLTRYSPYKVRRRLLQEDKKLLLEALAHRAHRRKAHLERRIHRVAESALEKLSRLTAFADQLSRLRQERAARAEVRATRRQLRDLEHRLRRDFRAWSRLCLLVLRPQATPTA
jgi:stearoyl-CoA desaturase (delta-9 desaturase)